jgi:hypothetical protein
VKEKRGKRPYLRRSGVIRRSGQLGSRPGSAITGSPNVIDSGEDAPLSEKGQAIFRYSVLGIFVVFVILALLTASGH